MPLEIDYYNLSIHKLMLRDRVRCEAFSKALAETITPDCAVLDIGAGTGILSLFAVQAGARIVYAVERTDTAKLARRIVLENGFENKIKIFQNDMENVELPEKVDVIVSEWLGGYGIDENLLPIVIHARDRWLKSGGKMLPSKVTSWIAPAYDELLLQDVVFWCNKPYGLNMTAIAKDTYQQLHCCRNHIKKEQILCAPQMMWRVDASTCQADDSQKVFDARMEFVTERKGSFNCLAAWFKAKLTDNITLSNEPSEEYTHWGRWAFPVGENISVEKEMKIDIHFVLEPKGKGQTKAVWAVSVGDYNFRSEDTTKLIQ